MTLNKIWCLMRVADEFGQPETSLKAWFKEKPSIEFLLEYYEATTDEDIENIVNLWKGETVNLFAENYKLQEITEGFLNN